MTQRAQQVSGAWMEARLDLKIKPPQDQEKSDSAREQTNAYKYTTVMCLNNLAHCIY